MTRTNFAFIPQQSGGVSLLNIVFRPEGENNKKGIIRQSPPPIKLPPPSVPLSKFPLPS